MPLRINCSAIAAGDDDGGAARGRDRSRCVARWRKGGGGEEEAEYEEPLRFCFGTDLLGGCGWAGQKLVIFLCGCKIRASRWRPAPECALGARQDQEGYLSLGGHTGDFGSLSSLELSLSL